MSSIASMVLIYSIESTMNATRQQMKVMINLKNIKQKKEMGSLKGTKLILMAIRIQALVLELKKVK